MRDGFEKKKKAFNTWSAVVWNISCELLQNASTEDLRRYENSDFTVMQDSHHTTTTFWSFCSQILISFAIFPQKGSFRNLGLASFVVLPLSLPLTEEQNYFTYLYASQNYIFG